MKFTNNTLKSEFLSWLYETYSDSNVQRLNCGCGFKKLPLSAQFGLLTEFCDTKGISLGIFLSTLRTRFGVEILSAEHYSLEIVSKSRSEAMTACVDKLNEIYD